MPPGSDPGIGQNFLDSFFHRGIIAGRAVNVPRLPSNGDGSRNTTKFRYRSE
jgi:hypothetical protein